MEKQRFSTDNLIALCNTDEQVRYSINQIGDHLNDLCDGEDYRITLMEEEPQDKKLFRWRNALPGHRAFSRLVKKDSRIDEEKPKLKLGELPEEPKSQNSLWYSLYKKCSDAITVSEAHKTFLLARDLATVSFVFAIMGPRGSSIFWPQGYLGASILRFHDRSVSLTINRCTESRQALCVQCNYRVHG